MISLRDSMNIRLFNFQYMGVLLLAMLFIGGVLLTPNLSFAKSPKVSASAGYDSNPFRFNDQFNPVGARFTDLDFAWKHVFESGFYLDSNANTTRYESGFEDANSNNIRLKMGLNKRFKLKRKRLNAFAEFAIGRRDKTYVSRLNGAVGQTRQSIESEVDESDSEVFSSVEEAEEVEEADETVLEDEVLDEDEEEPLSETDSLEVENENDSEETAVERRDVEIGDRYDYERYAATWGVSIKPIKQLRMKLFIEMQDRRYEDYAQLGLSNLNYSDYGVANQWRYKPLKRHTLNLLLRYDVRRFEDRRARLLSGQSIDGSDLAYDMVELDLNYRVKFNSGLNADAMVKHTQRTDNATGYYNARRTRAALGLSYAASDSHKIGIRFGRSNLTYPLRVSQRDTEEDEFSDEAGYFYALRYSYSPEAINSLKVLASLKYDDYQSDILQYTYRRTRAELDVKWRF